MDDMSSNSNSNKVVRAMSTWQVLAHTAESSGRLADVMQVINEGQHCVAPFIISSLIKRGDCELVPRQWAWCYR